MEEVVPVVLYISLTFLLSEERIVYNWEGFKKLLIMLAAIANLFLKGFYVITQFIITNMFRTTHLI